MAVAYVNSGTFSGVQPGPATPGYPASLVVGNLLIAVVDVRVGGDPAPATCAASGWTTWFDDAGPGNSNTQFVMYRWVDGTEGASASFAISGVTTNGVFARIHQFSGAGPGSGTPNIQSGGLTQATNTTPGHVAITTTKSGALAFCAISHADDTGTAFTLTGESGGTWAKRFEDASSVGGDGRISIYTSDLAEPTTLSGGAGTTTGSIRWISRSFALIPGGRESYLPVPYRRSIERPLRGPDGRWLGRPFQVILESPPPSPETLALAELASGTGQAFDATCTIAPTADLATGAGQALDVAASIQPTAESASGAGQAYDATVATGATEAQAELATGTGQATDAAVAIAPSAGAGTGAGTANDPSAAISVLAEAASGTGEAYNAAGSTNTGQAQAGLASGSGAAQDATIAITASAEAAAGSGAAQAPAAAISVSAGLASGTGTANDASASPQPPGGLASGSGTAHNPTVAITVLGGLASGTGTAYNVSTAAEIVSTVGYPPYALRRGNQRPARGTDGRWLGRPFQQTYWSKPVDVVRQTADSGVGSDAAWTDTPGPTESAVGADNASVFKIGDALCGPYTGPVEIRYDGVDITTCVIYAPTRFKSSAGGIPGTCKVRIRDRGQDLAFVTGRSLELKVEGEAHWTGYVTKVRRGYFFEGTPDSPGEINRYYELDGVDLNVLFQKRALYDKVTPTNVEMTTFDPGTPDNEIIEHYVQHHLDLSGDGISLAGVQFVGTPSNDDDIFGVAGETWGQFQRMIRFNTGAIDYIDPDRVFQHVDVDTPTAPFGISDNPVGSGEIGARDLEIDFDGSQLRNDVMIWGAGQGAAEVRFQRIQDSASITEHGTWQVGQFLPTVYKQETVDRIADSYVYGSPQNRRGGKDDAVTVRFTTFERGLRVAQKITVRSEVYDFTRTLPIRSIEISFPTPDDPQFSVIAAEEIDDPWSTAEFFFPDFDFDFDIGIDFDLDIPEIDPFDPCIGARQWRLPIEILVRGGLSFNDPDQTMHYSFAVSNGGGAPRFGFIFENFETDRVDLHYWCFASSGGTWDIPAQFQNNEPRLQDNVTSEQQFYVRLRIEQNACYVKAWMIGAPEPSGWGYWVTRGSHPNFQPGLLDQLEYFVELNGGVGNKWRTDFIEVVQGYGSGLVGIDNFNRTVADGIGVAFNGQIWSIADPPGPGGPAEAALQWLVNGSMVEWESGDYFSSTATLPVPTNTIGSIDTFSRSVGRTGVLGTSEYGPNWETESSSLLAYVSGGEAVFDRFGDVPDISTGNGEYFVNGIWTPPATLPLELLFKFTVEFTKDSLYYLFELYLGWTDGGELLSFPIDPDAAWIFLGVEKVGSNYNLFAETQAAESTNGNFDRDTIYTWTAPGSIYTPMTGTFWARVRLDANQINASVWRDGDPEPGAWTIPEQFPGTNGLDGKMTSIGMSAFGVDYEDDYTGDPPVFVGRRYTQIRIDDLEITMGSDPCFLPTRPLPDPPSGPTTGSLPPMDPPPGWNPAYHYFATGAYIVRGSSRVWIGWSTGDERGGVYLRLGVDYFEGPDFIAIVDTVDVTGKTVYCSYRAG